MWQIEVVKHTVCDTRCVPVSPLGYMWAQTTWNIRGEKSAVQELALTHLFVSPVCFQLVRVGHHRLVLTLWQHLHFCDCSCHVSYKHLFIVSLQQEREHVCVCGITDGRLILTCRAIVGSCKFINRPGLLVLTTVNTVVGSIDRCGCLVVLPLARAELGTSLNSHAPDNFHWWLLITNTSPWCNETYQDLSYCSAVVRLFQKLKVVDTTWL